MDARWAVGFIMVGVTGITLATGRAEERIEELKSELTLDVFSSYTSRGQVNNDRPVVQPTLNLSKYGIIAEVWGNYNVTDRVGDKPNFSEVDLTLGYTLPVEGVDMQVGIIDYEFPNTTVAQAAENETLSAVYLRPAPSTREVYWKGALPNAIVTPGLEVYYDFDQAHGFYCVASLERECGLCDRLTLTPGCSSAWASSGYNDYFFGVRRNALNDGNVFLNSQYSITQALKAGASFCYTWLWDTDIRDGADGIYMDTHKLWGGVTVEFEF